MLEPVGRPSSTKSAGAMRLQGHMRAIRARTMSPVQMLKARLAGPLRPLLDSAFVQRTRALGRRLAAAGTDPYPPDVRRRLKILNVICYLIATTNFLYAVQQATTDFATYAPMVYMNLALVAAVLLVPVAHRVNEIAGGVLLVVVEYAALVGFAAFFSREGGAHLQYFIAAAAAFVIFGLRRLWLIAVVVLVGLGLHLYVWYSFPATGQVAPHEQAVIDSLYTQARDHDRRADRGVGLLRVQPGRAGEGGDGRGAAQRSA